MTGQSLFEDDIFFGYILKCVVGTDVRAAVIYMHPDDYDTVYIVYEPTNRKNFRFSESTSTSWGEPHFVEAAKDSIAVWDFLVESKLAFHKFPRSKACEQQQTDSTSDPTRAAPALSSPLVSPIEPPTTRSQKKAALSRARELPSDSSNSATNSPVKKLPRVVKGGRGGKKSKDVTLSPRKDAAKRIALDHSDLDVSHDSSTLTNPMSDVDKALDSSFELKKMELAHKTELEAVKADAIKVTGAAWKLKVDKVKRDMTKLKDTNKAELDKLSEKISELTTELKESKKLLKQLYTAKKKTDAAVKLEDESNDEVLSQITSGTPTGGTRRKSRTPTVSPPAPLDPIETFKHTVDTTTNLLAYSIKKTKDFDDWRASLNVPTVAPVDFAAELKAMKSELKVLKSSILFTL